MRITEYLTDLEQDKIKKMYQVYLDNEEKVRVKVIAISIEVPAALVKKYILEQYGEGAKDNLYHAESHYIDTNKGYIRYKDYYNLYEHQFVICRELDIKIKDIGKYTVHHKDKDKTNNQFENLHLFYNADIHSSWHWLEGREPAADLLEFTFDYIEQMVERDITSKERKAISDYMKLLDIQIQRQKNIPSNKFADLNEGILELHY